MVRKGILSIVSLSFFVAFRPSDVFERPTLRGCQCGDALGRVKALSLYPCPAKRLTPMGLFEAELMENRRCVLVFEPLVWLDMRLDGMLYR